jgi:hypothetical protein
MTSQIHAEKVITEVTVALSQMGYSLRITLEAMDEKY